MTKFLNKYSKTASRFSDADLTYRKDFFNSFIEYCSNITAEDNIFIDEGTNKFNIILLDAIFVVVGEEAFKKKELLNGKINKDSLLKFKREILTNQESKFKTGTTKDVKDRIATAKEIMKN